MIVVSFRVGLRTVFVGQIDTVAHRQRRQFGEYFVPGCFSLLSEALPPPLGDAQTKSPIGQLEGRIPRLERRMVFLGRNQGWSKHISVSLSVEVGIGSHKLRRLENQPAITFQRCMTGARPVTKLRVEDRVRLLPDQQRPDRKSVV